jgi:hypothetical protein
MVRTIELLLYTVKRNVLERKAYVCT